MKANTLMIIAVLAVAFALFNLITTIDKVGDVRSLTGYAGLTDTGTANLSIQGVISINFTRNNINWGTGSVDVGFPSATLDTEAGTVTDGSGWTSVGLGLLLQNLGSVDVNVTLAAGKTAAQFIGGSQGGGPLYQWAINEDSEPGSCIAFGGVSLNPIGMTNVVTGAPGQNICGNFTAALNGYTANEIEVDVLVRVPADALGVKADTITATAWVQP